MTAFDYMGVPVAADETTDITPTKDFSKVEVKTLNQENPEFTDNKSSWEDYDYMFHGGRNMRRLASRFLTRRPKEPDEVFNARIKRFIYTNMLATILGWYAAKVFRREPEIDLGVADKNGAELPKSALPINQAQFFGRFSLNCDRRGTTFIDFFRRRLIDIMLYGRSYMLVDLPYQEPGINKTLYAQQKAGALDPYLVNVSPRNIQNWEKDDQGQYEWVIIYNTQVEQELFQLPETVNTWTVFDRQMFRVYETRFDSQKSEPQFATLVRSGPHAMSAMNKVPLIPLEAPDGLYLADRLYFPCMDHLNTENAFAWALMNSNLAVPVITGAREDQLQFSEVQAYFLPTGATFTWTEHSGKTFDVSQHRLETIREESFRLAYLVPQGRSTSATAAAQSGVSKQQDMQPANDILSRFGDSIRADQQNILGLIGETNKYPNLYVDVRGYSFDGNSPIDDLDVIASGIALQIPSDTLDKELLKKAGRILLPDANQSLIAKMDAEIDEAPSAQDRASAQIADQTQTMIDKFRQAIDRGQIPISQQQPPATGPGSGPASGGGGKGPGGKGPSSGSGPSSQKGK